MTRRFKSPYWDVPPVGYESITPKRYKAMQAAGQVPQSVVNPSSQHLQGTKFAHPTSADPMAAARAAAAIINAQILKPNYIGSGGVGGGQLKTGPPAITRQARRLYVGNIPFGCTDDEMIEFFKANMERCNFIKKDEIGSPVLACQINLDKNFAFLEFRTVEETTMAMALDGIQCKGQALKIRRPHDYQPVPGSEPKPEYAAAAMGLLNNNGNNVRNMYSSSGNGDTGATTLLPHRHSTNDNVSSLHHLQQPPYIPGVVSTIVADSPNKIYIGGIPTHATDDQIKELLSTFGTLRAFNLIRDPATLASKGYAFCEYLDSAHTDVAIAGLNGFDIGGKSLIVQRASVGAKSGPLASGGATTTSSSTAFANNASVINASQSISTSSSYASSAPVQIQVPGLQNLPPVTSAPRVLTEVLCLMNMVEPDELRDDEEYQEILEDIESECLKYGRVKSIEIPRPIGDDNDESSNQVPGLGKVYVEFDTPTEAQRALMNIAGQRFANRVVVAAYFDRDQFRCRDLK